MSGPEVEDAAEAPLAKKAKVLQDVQTPANDAITFHLLKLDDGQVVIEEDGHFPPEMTHQ